MHQSPASPARVGESERWEIDRAPIPMSQDAASDRAPTRSSPWPTPDLLLGWTLGAAVVEFLALRVVTRVGEFLPGDGWRDPLNATMTLGLAALNVAALGAALAALLAVREWLRRPRAEDMVARGFAGVLVDAAMPIVGAVAAIAVAVNVAVSLRVGDAIDDLRTPMTALALVGALIVGAIGGVRSTVIAIAGAGSASDRAARRTAMRSRAPVYLAIAAFAIATIPYLLPADLATGWSSPVRAIAEGVAVLAALLAPLALSRRPGPWSLVIGVGAAALVGAVLVGRPTTAASFAMWNASFILWLPWPAYALATGTLGMTLAAGVPRRLGLALAVLALAGLRPEATYPALLALAAATATATTTRD